MNKAVFINDVGPRDGLQNQSKVLSASERLSLIKALIDAKLDGIEVGAFVSPKAVPAMAGTDEICQGLPEANCHFSALIPNMKGFELSQSNGITLSSLVMAVSNTMNQKNIRMDNANTLSMIDAVLEAAKARDHKIQVYLATAWECPFEGKMAIDDVLELAEQLMHMGAERLVIADTIGAADPQAVNTLMTALNNVVSNDCLACHFHDTRAMGLANVYAAMQVGIRRFDASIAGLGGCPFAPGASGNVATEDVVMMCEQMGYATGIDMPSLLKASDLACTLTPNARGGSAKTWLKKQLDNAG